MTGDAGGLAPDRHPQGDFFICDLFGAQPKDDLGSMEHPIFSLATRPDRRVLRYEHNGIHVEVTPSVKGRATIHDKDILIYCVSQLVAGLNAGRAVSRHLTLTAHDLLVATNRDTSGDAYARLREAFERLAGTRITTDIVTGGQETTAGFGLIEAWEIVRRTRGGRMVSVKVTLSDWLYRAVLAKSVLTLSRDYFRLRKPLERRVYELARKHCGRQPEWRVGVATLHKKAGSAAPLRVFRAALRRMIEADALPGYHLDEAEGDVLQVRPRRDDPPGGGRSGRGRPESGRPGSGRPGSGLDDGRAATAPALSEAALMQARALRPGADVHALAARWRETWQRRGRARLAEPDAAFLGWLRAGGDAD